MTVEWACATPVIEPFCRTGTRPWMPPDTVRGTVGAVRRVRSSAGSPGPVWLPTAPASNAPRPTRLEPQAAAGHRPAAGADACDVLPAVVMRG